MAACPYTLNMLSYWKHFASPTLLVTMTHCFSHFWKSRVPAATETFKYPISTATQCIAKHSLIWTSWICITHWHIAVKSVLMPYILQSGNCFISVKNTLKKKKKGGKSLTQIQICTSKGIDINPSKSPSLYKISRCYFCCFMEWSPWFNTLPDSIFSRRLILHSFSKLSSIRPELWLSKQTLDYGGHSGCAEMGVPGVLCLSQTASRAVAITAGGHTHPEQQGQGLLPSSLFYTGDQGESSNTYEDDGCFSLCQQVESDCSLPRWDSRDNTPGFNRAVYIIEQEYHRRTQ